MFFTYIFAQRHVRPIDPEEQLILVAGVEVVVYRGLAFTTDSFVADKKVSTGAQSHEDVIVQEAVGDDVPQAELQCGLSKSLLIGFSFH